MNRSYKDWLAEGESLYSNLLNEFEVVQAQINELEKQLISKRGEVNELASIIGKPVLEQAQRLSVNAVDAPPQFQPPRTPTSSASIARALTGDVAVKLL